MTHPSLLEVGDKVCVTFAETSYLRKRFPDGTGGVVGVIPRKIACIPRLSEDDLLPGVYSFKGREDLTICLSNGQVISRYATITMVDEEEERRRNAAAQDTAGTFHEPCTRLCDLPETEFWELDKVVLVSGVDEVDISVAVIAAIDYTSITHYGPKEKLHLYSYYKRSEAFPSGWKQIYPDYNDRIILVERGNLWKYYHGETELSLDKIREERDAILKVV